MWEYQVQHRSHNDQAHCQRPKELQVQNWQLSEENILHKIIKNAKMIVGTTVIELLCASAIC